MAAPETTPARADLPLEESTPHGTVALLALATDGHIEDDLRRLLPPTMRLCTTRLANSGPITAQTLRATAEHITQAASRILPETRLDAVVYGCTAGAAAIGQTKVVKLLRRARPAAACLSPLSAATAAMRHLGIERPCILTPNVPELHEAIVRHFTEEGFTVTGSTGLGIREDADITRVAPRVLVELAQQLCAPEADGLLVCCTSLRASGVIDTLEERLGRPVVTSNQALVWELARQLDLPPAATRQGRLFQI
jgi:maleate isomerase